MTNHQESFFRDLVEKCGSPIAAYGRDGRFVYVNAAYARLLDRTPASLVGTPIWSVNPAIDKDQFHSYWSSFAPGETRTNVTIHERADGSTFHVEASTTRQNIDGTTFHFGTIRDLSDRILREQTLEALHTATRRLMEATTREEVSQIAFETTREVIGHDNCGVWFHDETDDVLRASVVRDDEVQTRVLDRESFLWYSYQRGEPTRYDHVQERDHHEWTGDHEALRAAGISAILDVPLGDHGVFGLVSYDREEIPDTTESFVTILAANTKTALDRAARETTLRDQRQELQRQNEQLEQFGSVLSHDLRNPLNVAQGNLELAAEECESDRLPAVATALDRMESMIDDLLSLARSGRRAGETTSTAPGLVAKRAWSITEGERATLDVESDVGEIDADPRRLRQLFENLFRNAVEHAGDSVTVSVGQLPSGDGFYVEDDGPGLGNTDRDRLFEYGYSASGGTGLGLAIVKDIVDAHGWSIRSADTPQGARFEISTGPGDELDATDEPAE